MSGNGPLTGMTFNNRYELGERIGQGGMAEVYSAQDLVLGRIVAVKTMLPQYASDPDFTRRFRQEAAAAANLQSPYIVNVYDWGHDGNTYYIVMEFVRGSDLKSAIQERGAINQRKVAEIGAQVCQALTVAHQQDIVHRDVKPQNIMVQPDGNVKVMDFGIARAKNSTAQKTETVLGTAHYTSPEQAQGLDLTAASDIYSLGVVLYEAATGTLPFDGPDAVSVALMQVQDEPEPPRAINPDIDPEFEAIIMTAMQKNPAKRFATANDMRLALNDYLAGRPVNFGMLGGAAVGAAAGVAAGMGSDFTSARTRVLKPIGAAANDIGSAATQVMPVQGLDKTATYGGSVKGKPSTRRYSDSQRGSQDNGKGKGPIIAVAVIAAIVVIGIIAFMLLNGGEKITVPDVIGMSSEEASAVIEDAGFQVGSISNTYDDKSEAGKVVSQNPKGGSSAAKGSKIDIVISQGNELIEVPNVEGMSEPDAKQALIKAGFTVGQIEKEYSDKVDEGKVISQSPVAKSQGNKGQKVDLVVSEGAEQITVPDIEGMSVEAAKSRIEDAGLKISQSGSDFSSTVDANLVLSQKPAAGTKAKKGDTVTYVLSKGPDDKVTVPNVVGNQQSYATGALEGAGLKVSVVENYSDSVPQGAVIQQNPAGGATAKKGDTVSIEVSKGPSFGGGDIDDSDWY